MKKILGASAVAVLASVSAQAATVDLTQGTTEAATAQLIAEQSGVTVDDTTVDYVVGTNINVGDTVGGVNQFSSGVTLEAGTYDSYVIHFDPLTKSGSTTETFSFGGEIVALVVSNGAGRGNNADGITPQLLNDTDSVFGMTSSVYETSISRRSESSDTFTLVDAFTLTANFATNGHYIDNIRVITEVSPVPVPATLPLLLAGFGGLAALRRRK